MDILLIATHCNGKPWYLTRADVFKNKIFRPLFEFLQMLPVYRIRDGKANLPKNKPIFERCGRLLDSNEAILLFPEANHSLIRRVRPLSKGFTRIIDATLRFNPNLDVQLVPIGQNYQCPRQVGDSAALYFGKPIAIKEFKYETDFVGLIKQKVFEELGQLTTHIEAGNYENILSQLEAYKVDFTHPDMVNKVVALNQFENSPKRTNNNNSIARFLFRSINVPIIFLWRFWLKPKVPEPEFEATYRFGFSLTAYPVAYFSVLLIVGSIYNIKTACLIVIGHAALNLILVKFFGITSSHQKR